MRESEIERYQRENEGYVEAWKSYGIDLVDAGSPNPCSRSANARKVLGGRWQEAYEEWLEQGEFSRPLEEMYLGFILASKKIIHGGASAKIPTPLPKRIWSPAEYQKALRRYRDIRYRNKVIASLLDPGTTVWRKERVSIGTLVKENRPEEAERLFYQFEWEENDLAEDHLALIRTCALAESEAENVKAMWFYAPPGGQRRGPAGFGQMIDAFRQGKLMRTCLVWREGMPAWQPAASVKCFADVAYAGVLPPPLPRS